jgi:hypothetical protein
MYIHPTSFDTYILEYITKPYFWVLSLFLLAHQIYTAICISRSTLQASSYPSSSSLQETSPSSQISSIRLTTHLQSHLSTPSFKRLALLLYLVILVLQLLEGYYITITLLRWTIKLLSQCPVVFSWVSCVYILSVAVLLSIDVFFIGVGVFILFIQVASLIELVVGLG